ncbi:MAG: hypothetical protein K2X99_04175 [Gemmatimonadaceae bacterium]|nr:hypothetical protein [Gemmatimonadaceae bacterium]
MSATRAFVAAAVLGALAALAAAVVLTAPTFTLGSRTIDGRVLAGGALLLLALPLVRVLRPRTAAPTRPRDVRAAQQLVRCGTAANVVARHTRLPQDVVRTMKVRQLRPRTATPAAPRLGSNALIRRLLHT